MPGPKNKYSVRFSPKRIKEIMQKDREVGRISKSVPVIISRVLEMFVKSLLTKTFLVTQSKFSSMVSVSHMTQCIESEMLFDFLRELAERTQISASQSDNRGMALWQLYRDQQHISVGKSSQVGENATDEASTSLMLICSSNTKLHRP